jgi:hypothetical protein
VFARGDGIQHVHVSQHVALVLKKKIAECLVEVM